MTIDTEGMVLRAVTMEQAMALGFSERRVYRMVAAGDWTKLHEGVFVMASIPIDALANRRSTTCSTPRSADENDEHGWGRQRASQNERKRLWIGNEPREEFTSGGTEFQDVPQADVEENKRREEIWKARLSGLLLRAGDGAMVSHRAAARLHGMEGIDEGTVSAFVEATVASQARKFPAGIHRTRYPDLNPTFVDGFWVTSIERTLRDIASCCSFYIVEQALESILRGPDRTRPDQWNTVLLDSLRKSISHNDRLPGTYVLKSILQRRSDDARPTGSLPETQIFQALRHAGIETVTQPEVRIVDGSGALLDELYPDLGLVGFPTVLEVDGLKAHSSASALVRDLHRQNKLLRGFRVLRYPASKILEDPSAVAAEVLRGLAGVSKVGSQWQLDNVTVTYSQNQYLVVDRGRDARAEAEIARRRRTR